MEIPPLTKLGAASACYKHIEIQLEGKDGNALNIVGRCILAMKRAGISQTERILFQEEALSGDYDHLLRTVMDTFDVS